MKGQIMRVAVIGLLAFGLTVAQAQTQRPTKAPEPSKPLTQTYTGTVKVTKDKAGQITSAKLNVGGLLPRYYAIALDRAGKELARKMDGKRVQVKGLLERKSRATVLVVRQFSQVISKSTSTTTPKSANSTPKR